MLNITASIAANALKVVDTIVFDFFEDLAVETKKLTVRSGKRTLDARDVCSATLIHLRGRVVAQHAVGEGQKALRMYADLNRR